MKILFASSEIHPLIKTGGLADVAGALPVALRQKGLDIQVIMPAYSGMLEKVSAIHQSVNLGNPFGVGDLHLLQATLPDSELPIYLVQCQSLFEREGGPYLDPQGQDFQDNHLRFAAFSWACAFVAQHGHLLGWQPDILHLNDWQTGFAAAYLKSWKLNHIPIVTTVHNLRYNGSFDLASYPETRLSNELLSLHGMEFYGRYSALKAGLVYADAITTVSPTYAAEILTPAFGDGLDGTLAALRHKLSGILNGVDYNEWSPERDGHIAQQYTANNLDGKLKNKLALQRENNLPERADAVVFGVVSRLTEQKGLDLIPEAIIPALEQGAMLVLLGSGDKALELQYLNLQARFPEQVSIRIGYDEAYSHRLQAGVDVLLIPSRFEPCGLTQLYALKYGTLPLVRHTGGLADTVFEDGPEANGFVFYDASTTALGETIQRALHTFADTERWRTLQTTAMNQDHSWDKACDQWLALYRRLRPDA
ncbi:glycogen synthase GlgA [Marinomonas ostreistagni]|uniref:glycogen synthase GlgA n=1 Tax=Marinomonas ostreistagni TaxID=359209 RepID=UPI00194EAC32|nr:glycogen synthase GlgA [Marinomonas ostreistagni]MBM6551628.1 glycogen synthase GlgA [Marinomonas ostreistagni]